MSATQTSDDELRALLHRAVDHVQAPPELAEVVERRIAVHRRRGMRRRAAACGVVVALAGGIVASLDAAGGPATSTSPTQATPRTGQPGWSTIAPSTVQARFQHTMVWTGTEAVVLGGYGVSDGGDVGSSRPLDSAAAYDPATGLWRTIADYPVHDDDGTVAGAVWTGDAVLALGSEGALHAWSPVTDTWRELAHSPFSGTSNAVTGVVWTGSQLVVVNGGSAEDGTPDTGTAVYDPGSDTWRPVDPLPASYGFSDVLWTGERVVVVTQEETGRGPGRLVVALLDPVAGTWEVLDDLPLADAERRAAGFAIWSGTELVLGGGWGVTEEAAARGEELEGLTREFTPEEVAATSGYWPRDVWAWVPDTGSWRQLPDAPSGVEGLGRYADPWSGSQVLLWAVDEDRWEMSSRPLLLDPATGTWTEAPAIPGGFHQGVPIVWSGEEFLVWSGEPASVDEDPVGCCLPSPLGETFTP